MNVRSLILIFNLVFCSAAISGEYRLSGKIVQGGLVFGWANPDANIFLDGVAITQGKMGNFLLGFSYNAKPESYLKIQFKDGSVKQSLLFVKQRKYNIQIIDGLPKRKVTPSFRDLIRIKSEKTSMQKALSVRFPEPLYVAGFERPVLGQTTGVYGSQRILNGKPKRPHFGLDIAALEGSEIKSASDGMIIFTHPGMFFNGKTLAIDHGLGLRSIYIHMSAITVKKGDRVAKGQIVGRVGKTGRATGPHLHWGLQLNGTALDPEQLFR